LGLGAGSAAGARDAAIVNAPAAQDAQPAKNRRRLSVQQPQSVRNVRTVVFIAVSS
jgi:hypothetical protein